MAENMDVSTSLVVYNGEGRSNGDNGSQDLRDRKARYEVRHGLAGNPRVQICWGNGNHIRLSFLPSSPETGKILDVTLGPDVQDGAEERRIANASLPCFGALQSQRHKLLRSSPKGPQGEEMSRWWETVLSYSRSISSILGAGGGAATRTNDSTNELKPTTTTRAIWDFLEIFYVDKSVESYFSERLVEWLLTHGEVFSKQDASMKHRLVSLKLSLSLTVFPEDEPDYWEAMSSALAVGWLDFVVKLLRLHGSYRHDQIDDRQTENGLVEAVAVLVSKMPRLRPSIPAGEPGIAYQFKPEFAKEWEGWRMQVTKLDRSVYWSECHHKSTLHGLRKLLEILLGKIEAILSSTSHWMEVLVAHYLHVVPFSSISDGLIRLVRTCIDSKSSTSGTHELQGLLIAIMSEDTEVVIAECAKLFEPWMMAHMVDLLKAKSTHAQNLLQKESDMQGGISLEELYRVTYAQSLASHPLTWHLAPVYLAVCPRQGLGMLESVLLKLPVAGDSRLALKSLEVCRLYDLQAVGGVISRKVGVHFWKHGLTGAAIVWLQKANDTALLSAISEQLLSSVSSGITCSQLQTTLEQMHGLADLLLAEFNAASGGLSFLYRYNNFKSATQKIWEIQSSGGQKEKLNAAGKEAAKYLMQLFEPSISPKKFWMSLLVDSVELLEWPDQVLLNTKETNILLNRILDLNLARLCGDVDNIEISGPTIDRVRLALATNLSRSLVKI